MDSSRSRIDQFFPSRKRKPPSAKAPEASPKGSLDVFLERSPGGGGKEREGNVRRNLGDEIGSFSRKVGGDEVEDGKGGRVVEESLDEIGSSSGFEVGEDLGKKSCRGGVVRSNLTVETGFGVRSGGDVGEDCGRGGVGGRNLGEISLSSRNGVGVEVGKDLGKNSSGDGMSMDGLETTCGIGSLEKRSGGGELLRSGPVKRNLTRETGLSLTNEVVCGSGTDSLGKGESVVREPGGTESGAVGSCLDGGSLQLKRFASDFLSLYCSELPSTENIEADEHLKGQKRNGSPSLLEANIKVCLKKHCVVVKRSSPEIGETAPLNDTCGLLDPELEEKQKEANIAHPKELDGTATNGAGIQHDNKNSFASLRRCNTTAISNVGKASDCTPASSKSVSNSHQTPGSACRHSKISPGDDFWDEAIQVADCLICPINKSSIQDGDKVSSKDEQKITIFGSKRSSRGSSNENDGGNEHWINICRLKAVESCTEDKSSSLSENKKASPLPVKHFDFSNEGQVQKNKASKATANAVSDVTQIKKYDSTSLNHAGFQSSASTTLSCLEVSTNKHLDSQHCSTLAGQSCTKKQHNKTSVEDDDGGLLLDRPMSTSSFVKKEAKETLSTNYEVTTPSSGTSLTNSLELHNWLPSELCSIYTRKGISKLYPWQFDCLQIDGVLERRNLVYCASTSAGKSFVAEILMIRRVISTGKMAILVLPYVSLCAEKADHLEKLLEPLGKHVRSFYGIQGGGSLPKDTTIAVCTIEKANSLVNRLLEEGRLSELGIIVIDELHMVGDQHRGYLLELLLTKLRYASGEGNTESCSGNTSGSSSGKTDLTRGLQVVGMSATMPNVSAVANWLQAALYQTDFRPVPLEEYIKVGNSIFNKKLDLVRSIARTADLGGKDPDHIVELCNEIVQEGHSVLIFCSSRKGCESTAKHISKFLQCISASTHECDGEFGDASSAVEALRRCPGGLDPTLEETLPLGVAYHHAGLTVEEREIVETCYRKGLIRVLTATSTLAAGVNLPARRVIFRQPKIGRDFIDGTRYRQMAGRAGRTGIDTKGESILICRPEELKRIASLLNDSCPPLQSCLSDDKNGMVHAILEVVSGGIVQTATDIHRYVRCTLLSSTKPFDDVVKSAQDSLRWLCHKKFLEWNEETRLYSTTPLGRASFGSSLSPEESLVVLSDLSRAREGFVLASDLHLVYLVTPINVEIEPDWELYYERFMELSLLEQSVGNRVGVTEPFLMRMAHGAPMHMPDRTRGKQNLQSRMQSLGAAKDSSHLSENQVIRVSKRFYVALMLARLVQEIPVSDVCDAFKVARGMIQSLQENAGRFASMVAVFCERLGWHDLEGLIGKFQNRVSFGVRAEIVELTSIPYVKGSRARALYKAGLRTPMAIAESPTCEIAKALFDSSSWATEEGSSLRRVQLGVAKRIKDGARKIVLEKAEEVRLAAFSAFSSLGVQVPEFPKFPLSGKVEASHMLVNGINFINEGDISHVKNKKEQGPQISARVDIEQTKDGRSNPSSKAKEDKSASTEGVTSNASTEESLSESCDQACIPLGKFGKDEIEIKRSCPSADLVSEGNIHSLHQKKCMYNVKNDPVSGMPLGNQGVVVSEKGPINVGSMPGGFDSFMRQWEMKEEFYFDCHFSKKTKTDSTLSFEIFGLAICWEQSPIYYINLGKYLCSNLGDAMHNLWENVEQRWNRIAKIMGEKGVRKISWNLKAQIQVLKHPTMSLNFRGLQSAQNESFKFRLVDNTHYALPSISLNDGIDVSIVLWILWPDEESCSCPNLDKVVRKHLSTESASTAIRDSRWRNQMQKAAHNGCCRRVSQTRALSLVLWRLLVSENLVAAVTRIENPLVKVLADMELWGIGVDVESCLHARHILGKKLKELEKEAIKLAGMSFSLYSTPEIANVLYARLKLPIPDSGKKGKQHPSTDKHSLELLRDHHPIIPVIREHRTLAKLLNSTLGSICSNAQLRMTSQRYLINGHWLQTSTATGRLSMEDPNLQCVEHAIEFSSQNLDKDEPSSSKIDHHRINARDLFIPTQDNWVLITADYSQIELRLMAHFSRDISLIQLLSKPEGDVFTMLAAKWTERDECSISSQEREQTKRLVYGILYGMGANTLADQLDCSPEDAKRKIQSFKSSFPRVSAWLQDAVAFCRQKGYVETLMGRKRYLSKIKFGTDKEQSKAQRQAVNSICQGSAADIIKMAMINIHSVIVEGSDLPSSSTHVGVQYSKLKEKCRILLQVHDELLLEVDPSLVSEAGSLLRVGMETAASLLVPLHVKLKVGRTWGSLEPFDTES